MPRSLSQLPHLYASTEYFSLPQSLWFSYLMTNHLPLDSVFLNSIPSSWSKIQSSTFHSYWIHMHRERYTFTSFNQGIGITQKLKVLHPINIDKLTFMLLLSHPEFLVDITNQRWYSFLLSLESKTPKSTWGSQCWLIGSGLRN
jgi:hypothetical protein